MERIILAHARTTAAVLARDVAERADQLVRRRLDLLNGRAS